MNPKEKAQELFDKHFEFVEALSAQNQIDNAKQCALITVDEIYKNNTDESKNDYWIEVKHEIEKI
jgi:hypothetical protein